MLLRAYRFAITPFLIEPLVCKSEAEINEKIKKVYFGGKILNRYLDPMDHSNTVKESVEWFYAKSNPDLNKEVRLTFQKNTLTSDVGLIMTDEREKEYFVLSQTTEKIATSDRFLDRFMYFNLHIGSQEKKYHLRYKKLQDLAAQIGGTMKILFFSIQLFLKIIVKMKYEQDFCL